MAIELRAVTVRHERRIRLSFTDEVGAGAFASTAPYTVTSLDGVGASPHVVAAMAVLSSPNVVELQLSLALADGGSYEVLAEGVPSATSGATPEGSAAVFSVGEATRTGTVAAVPAIDAILYGVDLRFEDGEFAEDATGDLATLSGGLLVRRDLWVRLLADGLPWDSAFGVRAREWVDGAPSQLSTLRGRVTAQMQQDDRVLDARVEILPGDDTTEATVRVTPTLLGERGVDAIEHSFRTATTS